MKDTFLVITSIASDENHVLQSYADYTRTHETPFIVIGDRKSPSKFSLEGCDFYSLEKQFELNFELAKTLPIGHYARKNLGYLIAISKGAKKIIETDDDNIPFESFWSEREKYQKSNLIEQGDWLNVYNYFSQEKIWPRGFALDEIGKVLPALSSKTVNNCPIQQGLADQNPDVDAIYRLLFPLPLSFEKRDSIALGNGSICPFNSQNTTWFEEAFPLMYLPSYCSFRMTDIWRSFIAQRIAWTCGWSILFHQSTVYQERNDHDLMHDFKDEVEGYLNNKLIMQELNSLNLAFGIENIPSNLVACYSKLIDLNLIGGEELSLLNNWLDDLKLIKIIGN
jgi:hypothetical protein